MVDRYDEELFLEYVEGELPVDKRLAFENQMLQDPRLRNLVAQMVLDRHRMRTLPDEAPPGHLMDAVHERLERAMLLGASPQEFAQSKPLAHKGYRWRRFATMGAMAAMVAVVAGVFVVTFVQLANDTPIRNVGPGSLFPPGMLPPSLIPDRANTAGTSPSKEPAKPVDSSPTDIAIKQPTPPVLALVPPALPDVATVVAIPALLQPAAEGGQGPATQLPEAHLVFSVTARDIPAASRRLTSWITAYEATQLDSRAFDVAAPNVKQDDNPQVQSMDKPVMGEVMQSVAEESSEESVPTANQAITLDPSGSAPTAVATPAPVLPKTSPQIAAHIAAQVIAKVAPKVAPEVTPSAPASGLMVTLALRDEQVLSLEMFLTTLPDAQVRRSTAEAAPLQTDGATTSSSDDLLLASPYVLVDRVDSPPSQNDSSNATAPSVTQQWLGAILPDWLLNPSSPAVVIHAPDGPKAAAGRTIVRVEFIPR